MNTNKQDIYKEVFEEFERIEPIKESNAVWCPACDTIYPAKSSDASSFSLNTHCLNKGCEEAELLLPKEQYKRRIKQFIKANFHPKSKSILLEDVEGIRKPIMLEEPRLFQSNPTPNEAGGYSSVPFYCSLCGMSELKIQDNKLGVLENDSHHYACHCSVWDSPTGGKWIRWYDEQKAKELLLDLPSEDNSFNSALDDILNKANNITK